MGALVVKGNRVVLTNEALGESISHTSGGKGQVQLSEYDAFLVYGLDFPLSMLESGLSAAVRWQACHDPFARALNFRICAMLRRATELPIYVGHDPQRAGHDSDVQQCT